MKSKTTAPIIKPAALFLCEVRAGGVTTTAALGTVILDAMSRDSRTVSDGKLASADATRLGCGFDSATDNGGVVSATPLGTAVTDASRPMTVGALTSELVCCERESAIVAANSLLEAGAPPTAFVLRPAFNSLARTAAVG